MPLRLCNALTIFQRLVMYIFTDLLYKSMRVFIDDFNTLLKSSQHLGCVRETLVRCRQMQLALNLDNTILGVQKDMMLSYMMSKKDREPDLENIAVVGELATPTNAKDIAKLLGHVGWYRELIPDNEKIVVPITQLFKKNYKFEWTYACQRPFEELRSKLSTYPVLVPSDWGKPFHVFCDASSVGLGSALYQTMEENKNNQPVAYASRQLTPAERNYPTTERECSAIVFSVKIFRHYLMYNPVIFFVDHMVIEVLVNKAELSGRLVRWILLLEEFDYTVEYKSRRMHLPADHLSRLSNEAGSSPVDDSLRDDNLFLVTAKADWYSDIVEFLTTQQLTGELTRGKKRKVRVNSRHYTVIGHRLFMRRMDGILRRCVSEIEAPFILAACHDSACGGYFLGLFTDQKVLRACYFWPDLFKDAKEYVRKCDACQRYARNDLRMEMQSMCLYP